MPELPEVETVMRGLEPVCIDACITAVDQRRKDLRIPFPDKMAARLVGCKIHSLKRRAKYIQVYLDDGNILVIHLGMSGRMSIIPAGEGYTPIKHDHLIIGLDNGVTLVYNDPRRFGMIFLVGQDDVLTHAAFAHLGPEPLGNEFSAPILVERLKGKKFSIKQALLDQKVVVGVGNIYACEALHQSGISPTKEARLVKGDKAEKLVAAIRDVLGRAIKAGGSTLKDYRHADGELGYFQHSFTVYGREKEECPTCGCNKAKGKVTKGSIIKRIVQSGRSTFYCSVCQR